MIGLAAGRCFAFAERLGYRPATRLIPSFMPPVALRLANMLRAGEYDRVRYTLSRLHPESLFVVLEAMLDGLDGVESSDRWLERLWQWYRTNREFYAMTALIQGLLRHARLCQSSGRRQAESLDALEEAERLLDKAIERQPDNADLLSLRLVTARGLAMPLSEHWKRFRALLLVAPEHYRGHREMLENLKPGAAGSHDAMFRLARARAASLPITHPLRTLPVLAHLAVCETVIPAGAHDDSASWFRQPAVVEEIVGIWQSLRDTLAEQGTAQADELLNHLAAALYLCGCFELATEALAHIDGRCSAAPWRLLCRSAKERHNPGWVVDRIKAEIAANSSVVTQ